MKKLLSVATVICLGSLSCDMASGMNTGSYQIAQCTQHAFDRAKQMHDQGNNDRVKNIVAIECQNTDVLYNLLWLAVHNNYLWLAEEIFKQYASQVKVNDCRDKSGRTLFMQAVINDSAEMTELLAKYGAGAFNEDDQQQPIFDQPVFDNDGKGVMYYAVIGGGRVLNLMLAEEFDFDLYCTNPLHEIPLVVAYENNQNAFEKMILLGEIDVNVKLNKDDYLLHRLIKDNNFDLFKLLIDRPDINLEVTNDWEQTPLLLAIFRNELDFVKQLIEHGADITAKDCSGGGIWRNVEINHFSVDFSLSPSVAEVFKYLLTIPAAVRIINEQDEAGMTVLHRAVLAKDNDAVELLCKQQNILISAEGIGAVKPP